MSSDVSRTSLYTIPPAAFFTAAITVGFFFIFGINTWSPEPPTDKNYVALGGTLAIMGVYILLIAKSEVESISIQQRADSCYYLGFILTLIAMVFALINFSPDAEQDQFQGVVINFGLAIATTVVGLITRIVWLQLRAENIVDGQQVMRAALLKEARTFELEIQKLTSTFISESDRLTSKFTFEVEKVTSLFSELTGKIEEIPEPLSKNLKNLEKTLVIPEKLASSLAEISDNMDQLKNRLSSLNNVVQDVLQGVSASLSADVFVGLNNRLENLSSLLAAINPELENSLGKFNSNLTVSGRKIEDYGKSLLDLLKQTEQTYSQVNQSLRDNADYIRQELNKTN